MVLVHRQHFAWEIRKMNPTTLWDVQTSKTGQQSENVTFCSMNAFQKPSPNPWKIRNGENEKGLFCDTDVVVA